MSEPPPPISPVDSLDQRPQDDNGNDTVPTEETQKVLEELDTVVTAPNSQENVVTPKQEFKEEKKTPPPQLSEWQLLLDRLRDSPHDPEGWNRLVDLAENSGTLEEIKATYDALLEVYPNTVRYSEWLFPLSLSDWPVASLRHKHRLHTSATTQTPNYSRKHKSCSEERYWHHRP